MPITRRTRRKTRIIKTSYPNFRCKIIPICEEFDLKEKGEPKAFIVPTSSRATYTSSLEKIFNKKFGFSKCDKFTEFVKSLGVGGVCVFHHKETNTFLIFLVLLDHVEQAKYGVDIKDVQLCIQNLRNLFDKTDNWGRYIIPRTIYMNTLGNGKFLKSRFHIFKNIFDEVFTKDFTFIVCEEPKNKK